MSRDIGAYYQAQDFPRFSHDVVVHQRNFVDPADETIHTQNIGITWQCAKRKHKRQYGTSHVLFTSYLSEYHGRNKYGNLNVFGELINTKREFYVL